jgi:O-antigen ligase
VLFNDALSRPVRVGTLLVAAGWMGRRIVAESDWLSGWFPAVLALLVIALAHSRRLFFLVLLGGVVVGMLNFDAFFDTQVNGDDAEGNFLRLELWEQSLEVMQDHLVLGTGAVGYAPYYLAFFPDRSLSTHSNLLDIFSETGVVGSLLFVWFIVATFRGALRARRRWPTGFGAGFVNGALGALVGMVVAMALGDWVIPFVYNQTIAGFRYTVHNWIFLGALAAMLRVDAD